MPAGTYGDEENENVVVLTKKVDANTAALRDAIMQRYNALRARHPWLVKHQDLIGLAILVVATAVTVISGLAVLNDCTLLGVKLPYLVFFFASAFATSHIHEIEHDLIHRCYFRDNFVVHNLMMLTCWVTRWNTVNPWARRRLHFHHHKASGTASDLEEFGITNGERWCLRRLVAMSDGFMSFVMRPVKLALCSKAYTMINGKTVTDRILLRLENATLPCPLGWAHSTALWTFVVFHGISFFFGVEKAQALIPAMLLQWLPLMTQYLWAFGFANTLRHASLVLVSSNMHYFGDIGVGEVLKQTQVWDTWWTLPLDLLTMNFGTTHNQHHVCVAPTYYERQWMFRELVPTLKKHGVRFNDFGTFLRANHWDKNYRDWGLLW